jgi:hypothetical protein
MGRLHSHMTKGLLIYDFAPDPISISFHMRKFFFINAIHPPPLFPNTLQLPSADTCKAI